jgi:hypothetical protein
MTRSGLGRPACLRHSVRNDISMHCNMYSLVQIIDPIIAIASNTDEWL